MTLHQACWNSPPITMWSRRCILLLAGRNRCTGCHGDSTNKLPRRCLMRPRGHARPPLRATRSAVRGSQRSPCPAHGRVGSDRSWASRPDRSDHLTGQGAALGWAALRASEIIAPLLNLQQQEKKRPHALPPALPSLRVLLSPTTTADENGQQPVAAAAAARSPMASPRSKGKVMRDQANGSPRLKGLMERTNSSTC